jgi:hypothetical protein
VLRICSPDGSEHEEEMFEDDPSEFIRRDLELATGTYHHYTAMMNSFADSSRQRNTPTSSDRVHQGFDGEL